MIIPLQSECSGENRSVLAVPPVIAIGLALGGMVNVPVKRYVAFPSWRRAPSLAATIIAAINASVSFVLPSPLAPNCAMGMLREIGSGVACGTCAISAVLEVHNKIVDNKTYRIKAPGPFSIRKARRAKEKVGLGGTLYLTVGVSQRMSHTTMIGLPIAGIDTN